MKKIAGLSLALVLAFSSLPANEAYAATDDITGHYFEQNMRDLIEEGIMGGYPDGTFKPDNLVTRAEFTSFLVRALDLNRNGDKKTFTDVKSGAWYESAIAIATGNNLIGGYPDGTFKPNNNITREEMAAMVQRALHKEGVKSGSAEIEFVDKDEINKIFHSAVGQLVHYHIMGGKSGNRFAPRDNTTRGETAAVLDRMMSAIEKNKPKLDPKPDPGSGDGDVVKEDYNIDFSKVVEIQSNNTPKIDGKGQFLASEDLVAYFANPNNFKQGSPEFFQFLKLSNVPGLTADQLNEEILKGKGHLAGMGDAFLNAAETYNVNVIYLMAHALHETANGTSELASGIEVGRNEKGELVVATAANRELLTNIKPTYNFFGIGAVDSNALEGGATTAYEEGWFTPKEAILGGAAYIDNGYIADGQDTLYKMRWNPANPSKHQYATHVEWATIQAKSIYKMYEEYGLYDYYALHYEVPEYDDTPRSSSKPTGEAQFGVDKSLAGVFVATNADNLRLRTYPKDGNVLTLLPLGAALEIIGGNGGWFKVDANGSEGWVSGDYVEFSKYVTIVDMGTDRLRVRNKPTTGDSVVLGYLESNSRVPVVTDENGNPVRSGDWYQIVFNSTKAWVHGNYVVE